jgi:1-aminocyclopropane-1-carboxylate synthase
MPPFPTPGDLVHVVLGASKDFCGSGLRIGVLYSKNTLLNQALGNIGYFASVPGPLQYTLSKLWSDDEWLDGFIAENRRRMLEAYTTLAGRQGTAGYGRV